MTTPTPADQLRTRIRRAICEASGFDWDPDELMEPDEYGEHADAVLAVLPAPTVTWAAVLAEAAAWFEADGRYVQQFYGHQIGGLLRRLVDEQPEAEAAPYPAEDKWIAEQHDGSCWEYLAGGADRGYVEGRITSYRARFPDDLTTRLVRATTTYTVEQLADEAQQPTPDVAEETKPEGWVPKRVSLGTSCMPPCRHARNWHTGDDGACTVGECGCAQFRAMGTPAP